MRPLFTDLPAPQPVFLLPPVQYPQSYPTHAPPIVYFGPPMPMAMSDKSKVTASVLQLVLPFGIGRFYTGHVGMGLAQLLVMVFTCGIGALWSWIDGIVLLSSGGTDANGRRLQG